MARVKREEEELNPVFGGASKLLRKETLLPKARSEQSWFRELYLMLQKMQ